MQNLITYSLVHTANSQTAAKQFLCDSSATVERWLAGKGERTDGGVRLAYGGRFATLHSAAYRSSQGEMQEWELTEPLQDRVDGEFRTTLQLAQKGEDVHLYLTLKAGYRESTIAPELPVSVKPPRVLFDLAKLPHAFWRFGPMPVGLKALVFGADRADMLTDWLRHADRPVPVVGLSEYQGEILHPHPLWQEKVVERLFGMALVVRFTSDLSWELTTKLGKAWSCFHGAVRIYWPGLTFDGNPFLHDLMTADSIMDHFGTDDRAVAADRLLNYLFERFRMLSTFSVRCPTVFPELRRASGAERVTELRRQVTAKRDATKAAADLAGQKRQLEKDLADTEQTAHNLLRENDELVKEIEQLEAKLTEANNTLDQLRYQNASGQRPPGTEFKPPPVQQKPQPQTILDAVEQARGEFADALIFGRDVTRQAEQLKEDAGPPSWVFTHLEWLAKASREFQEALEKTGTASIGMPVCDWLTKQGAKASPEKGNTMRTGGTARTWDFGNGSKFTFNFHTKPNDAAPHNQCVRIYFEWCGQRRKIVIGSVGRHPDG